MEASRAGTTEHATRRHHRKRQRHDEHASGQRASLVWRRRTRRFSKTQGSVGHDGRLAREDVAVEVARIKQEVHGDLGLCGSTLAATFMQRGLIDEYRPFVRPIVLGGGKPYFTALDRPIALRLAETRAFPGGVVLLRYERA